MNFIITSDRTVVLNINDADNGRDLDPVVLSEGDIITLTDNKIGSDNYVITTNGLSKFSQIVPYKQYSEWLQFKEKTRWELFKEIFKR